MSYSLDQSLSSRQNNFNNVRLFAAITVVCYHSLAFSLSARGADYLTRLLSPYTNAGELAVNIFFVLSGLFVTRSWLADPNLVRFFIRRIARIIPGLFVCCFVTTWCGVLFFSKTGLATNNFTLTMTSIFDNTSLHLLQTHIPSSQYILGDVYWKLPDRSLNGPLWTLFWEGRLYIALAFIAAATVGDARVWLLSICVATIAFSSEPGFISFFIWERRFLLFFVTGVLLACVAPHIYLNRTQVFLSFVYMYMAVRTVGFAAIYIFVVCLALWIGSRTTNLKILRHFQRNDYSFGIYIYHWPIIQILRMSFDLGPVGLTLLALALSGILAIASWFLVEQPSIRFSKRILILRWKSVPDPTSRLTQPSRSPRL